MTRAELSEIVQRVGEKMRADAPDTACIFFDIFNLGCRTFDNCDICDVCDACDVTTFYGIGEEG